MVNHKIPDSEIYYKPCSVDVEENAFVSRNLLIRYAGEEASLRESCCWRVEVPYQHIDDSSLEFTVELFYHKPIKNEKKVSAYAERATVSTLPVIMISRFSSSVRRRFRFPASETTPTCTTCASSSPSKASASCAACSRAL